MTHNSPSLDPTAQAEPRLESWKEIAAYLKRDVTTVRRWEKSQGLPVHRHLHHSRSSVFAYPSELDTWWTMRRPAEECAAAGILWSWPARAISMAVMLSAVLMTAGGGLINLQSSAAQGPDVVVRRVWSSPEVESSGSPSPDGRYLTYLDWSNYNLAVRDLSSKTNRFLTSGGNKIGEAASSVFSPDGKQIAYGWMNYEDVRTELRIVNLEGSEPRVVYGSAELQYLLPAAWSPDGKQILAVFQRNDRTRQIVIVSVADGAVRVLKTLDWNSPGKVSFSPDGSYVAFDFQQEAGAQERDVFVLAADGTRETRLVNHPADDFFLGWAPDGTRVLFASDRTGSVSAWMVPVADGQTTGPPELVKQDLGQVQPIGFTKRGEFYYGLHNQMAQVFVGELDAATGGLTGEPRALPKRMVRADGAPDWSPDGKYLAYVTRPISEQISPGSRQVAIRSVETGAERQLTCQLRSAYQLRWSPDGRFLLLAGYDQKNRFGLHIVTATTGELVQSILKGSPYWGEWSRDGKKVFYNRNPDGTKTGRPLMVRNLDSGQDEVLHFGNLGLSLALSPDGENVAFSVFDKEGSTALKVVSARGGEAREVLRLTGSNFGAIAWTRSGRDLLFVRRYAKQQKYELWRVSAQGGEPQMLAPSLLSMTQVSVHPDGRRIAYNAGESTSEVWVMENFLPVQKAAR